MSTFFEMDCGGETVTIEKTDDGDFIFHGWDEETGLAAVELGFKPSACLIIWSAINEDSLDEVLRQQCEVGDAAAVVALLFAGASVDAKDYDGWTPLHYAAYYVNADVTRVLLEAGASVDLKDSTGWTPLHLAAFRGHADLAKTLIGAGANVDARTNLKNTPLHIVADNGHPDIAKLLLKAGANFNAENHLGYTPLHTAERYQNKGVVKVIKAWIAEHGA